MENKHNYLIILITLLFLTYGCSQYNKVADDLAFLTPDKFQCTVMQIYSGDTFLCQLSGLDNERIKLIGITIPASKKKEAKNYTKSVLKRGTLVKIEPANEIRDSHGNIPAYVFVPGGKMLNIMLAEKGLAEINIQEMDKYKSSFIEIQKKREVEIIEETEN
ncbi:MAG: thermonuclease family protein [Thermodesulfobacteriota bacterium]